MTAVLESDPLTRLQSAARDTVRGFGGPSRLCQVTIDFVADGDGLTLSPEPPSIVVQLIAAEDVAKPGWDVSKTSPRFNGRIVPIYGHARDLLIEFVKAAGEPMSARTLRKVWGDYTPSVDTVRWTMSVLKKSFAKLFPDGETFIDRNQGGYFLVTK